MSNEALTKVLVSLIRHLLANGEGDKNDLGKMLNDLGERGPDDSDPNA